MSSPVIVVVSTASAGAGVFGCQGTFTYQNGIDLVKEFVHGIPVTAVDSQVAHIINSIIWYAYPWRWTINTIASTALVNDQQDYAAVPVDYHLMIQARIIRTDTTPDQVFPLDFTTHLEPDYQPVGVEALKRISMEPSVTKFRLDHPPTVPSAVTYNLEGEYQKVCPKIADADLSGTICHPDCYFNVFVEGVKWKFYQLSDDLRAGNVVVNQQGKKQYTGQPGVFHDALYGMVMAEDAADEGQFQFPDTALGVTGTGGQPFF